MRARRALVLAGTSAATFAATLDNTVVAVALGDLQRDLGAGVSGLQGVVTAYTVGLAALLLTGGALADIGGPRRVFLGGLTGFAIASTGCALAGSVQTLVVARAVQGCAAALLLPAALALLVAGCPDPERRGRAVALWAAIGSSALVAGPVVGGLLVAAAGWPAIFWINLPLCAVAAGAVLLAGPPAGPPLAPVRRRLDLSSQALVAGALAAATYAVVMAGQDGPSRPAVLSLAVAVGAGALLRRSLRRSPDPLLPPGTLRDRRLTGALVGALAASVSVFVLLIFVSLFLQLVQGRAAVETALLLLPLTGALVLTAPVAGRLTTRYGARPPVVLGLLVTAVGLGVLGRLLDPELSGSTLSLVLLLAGAGAGLVSAPVVIAALDALPGARSGLAAALVTVARELGGIVAVAGLGAVVVTRLRSDLTARLLAVGVPEQAAGDVVESVLRGGGPADIARATDGQVALDVLLRLREVAERSVVGSTRVALLVAAALMVAAAGTAHWTMAPPRTSLTR